ncbi:deaminase [Lithospermum erythrorhizon]|uniref:Deaminase n=1 Tax=Lithospermum erythrorhizon TaxID=34254 RepID=A0AAV3PTK7_LITER
MRLHLPEYIKRRHRRSFTTLKSIFQLFSRMINPTAQNEAQGESPPLDPTQPSIPISYPLKTLEELASRAYLESFHYPFNKAKVKLQSNINMPNRGRILVCHDMAGGYVDDKWVQGGGNADAYGIWHWYLIDVFVYFSHYLVTLPPPCWTNAAHKHGVKVPYCCFIP